MTQIANAKTLVANLRFKNITLIVGDSTVESTINRVKKFGPFDMIFIDGGHTYDIVKSDFYHYSQLLEDDGVIGMHDIKADGCPGVIKLWEELKVEHNKEFEFQEIFDDQQFINYGIGVVTKKKNI